MNSEHDIRREISQMVTGAERDASAPLLFKTMDERHAD